MTSRRTRHRRKRHFHSGQFTALSERRWHPRADHHTVVSGETPVALRPPCVSGSRRPKPNPDPLRPPHPHGCGGSVLLRPLVWFLSALDSRRYRSVRRSRQDQFPALRRTSAAVDAASVGKPTCYRVAAQGKLRDGKFPFRRGDRGWSRRKAALPGKGRAAKVDVATD